MYQFKRENSDVGIHPLGEAATTCIAPFILYLAALRIVAIASYYASSRLARYKIKSTLQAVQPRLLGQC